MKKISHASFLLITILFSLSPLMVSAHDFFVSEATYKNGTLYAGIGYGHNFPDLKPIADDRLHLFSPLQVVTAQGIKDMQQKGKENYQYEIKENLEKGDYLVLGTYKPTFWAKGAEGWKQADRPKYKELTNTEATHAENVSMFAKLVLNIDGADSTTVISTPVGQHLEMVPQVNPATVKVGQRFPVQVLVDGKPAKTVEVKAVPENFVDKIKEGDTTTNGYKAFYGRTDLNGIINIIPLKAGFWNAYVEVEAPFPDKKKADNYLWVSRLTFNILD